MVPAGPIIRVNLTLACPVIIAPMAWPALSGGEPVRCLGVHGAPRPATVGHERRCNRGDPWQARWSKPTKTAWAIATLRRSLLWN
jgi:hypothetical protein